MTLGSIQVRRFPTCETIGIAWFWNQWSANATHVILPSILCEVFFSSGWVHHAFIQTKQKRWIRKHVAITFVARSFAKNWRSARAKEVRSVYRWKSKETFLTCCHYFSHLFISSCKRKHQRGGVFTWRNAKH